MAENEISDFNEVNESNVDMAGFPLGENLTRPPMVNNIVRAIQGALKRWFRTDLFRLRNPADQSRLLAFTLAGGASSITRTATFPDGDGTVMFTNTALLPAQAIGASVVGSAYSSFATSTSVTSLIPIAGSSPTSSQGVAIFSASYTPKVATDLLRIRFSICATADAKRNLTAALFVAGGTGAVRAVVATPSAGDEYVVLSGEYEYSPGTLTPQGVVIRVGPDAGTMYINRGSGGGFYGGSLAATLVIEEIKT